MLLSAGWTTTLLSSMQASGIRGREILIGFGAMGDPPMCMTFYAQTFCPFNRISCKYMINNIIERVKICVEVKVWDE